MNENSNLHKKYEIKDIEMIKLVGPKNEMCKCFTRLSFHTGNQLLHLGWILDLGPDPKIPLLLVVW